MKWNTKNQNKITVFPFATIHVPCHPASQLTLWEIEKEKRCENELNSKKYIAMELGIEDRRSARHIVYYRFKHMHRYQRPYILSNTEKFNTVYPENQWSDQHHYYVSIYPYQSHPQFKFGFLSKRKMDKKLNHLTRFNCKMRKITHLRYPKRKKKQTVLHRL